jgi:hypothetical protein
MEWLERLGGWHAHKVVFFGGGEDAKVEAKVGEWYPCFLCVRAKHFLYKYYTLPLPYGEEVPFALFFFLVPRLDAPSGTTFPPPTRA